MSLGLSRVEAGQARPWSAASTQTAIQRGNGWIAFTSNRSGNNEIYRMDFDGGDQVDLTQSAASDTDPAWSPDGTAIAYTSMHRGNKDILRMEPDGSHVQHLTTDPSADLQPAWSPAGDRIAFTSDRDGNNEIYVMEADGSSLTRLTTDPGSDSRPAWSPSGRKIAFVSNRTGDREIFVMDPDGSRVADLSNDPGVDTDPAWAPDGAVIAFSSSRTGDADIFLMNPNGSGQGDITNAPGPDTEPVFAPEDGYRLAFTSARGVEPEIYTTWDSGVGRVQYDLTNDPSIDSQPDWQPLQPYQASGSPIQHVVILFMENQSFDSVLGRLCLNDGRCEAVTTGETSNGTVIDLHDATDIVPPVGHSWFAQNAGINGGQMNGFDLIQGCGLDKGYACYQQYEPEQIPFLAALARAYAISDRTFETDATGSWGAHFILASPDLDGFYQGGHHPVRGQQGPGWGCDSLKDGPWAPTLFDYFGNHYPDPPSTEYPNCVPAQDGSGPYRPSAVPWTPSIMDRMDEAGNSWGIYAPSADQGGYGWAICPTFADCLGTSQSENVFYPEDFAKHVAAGNLRSLSFVIPRPGESQHNGASMLKGDDWVAKQVGAVMASPDWASTAIFISWDDCGCFYDHVTPPSGSGIREPMLIISPFAKPGFTDSNVASFASMQAFIEHTFGLTPMSPIDATAYDYADSFDYGQTPLPPLHLHLEQHRLPAWEIEWLRQHPLPPDPT